MRVQLFFISVFSLCFLTGAARAQNKPDAEGFHLLSHYGGPDRFKPVDGLRKNKGAHTQADILESAPFRANFVKHHFRFLGLQDNTYFFESTPDVPKRQQAAFFIGIPPADEVEHFKEELQNLNNLKHPVVFEQINYADRFIVVLHQKKGLPKRLIYQSIIVYDDTLLVFTGYGRWSPELMEAFRQISISIRKK